MQVGSLRQLNCGVWLLVRVTLNSFSFQVSCAKWNTKVVYPYCLVGGKLLTKAVLNYSAYTFEGLFRCRTAISGSRQGGGATGSSRSVMVFSASSGVLLSRLR